MRDQTIASIMARTSLELTDDEREELRACLKAAYDAGASA